jgi:acylphosphatase
MPGAGKQGGGPTVRRRCEIDGRVQMVGFRAFASHHGRRLGLRGWVRNLPTGGVEVTVEGPGPQVGEFLALLEEGPAAAEVKSMVVVEEDDKTELPEFSAVA